jgi:cytochrome c biogenesis protein CcmG/thiol:disulfide interchange protein DsbE
LVADLAAQDSDDYVPLKTGDLAPGFTEPALASSGTVSLSALRGKVVLLNFWATWCPPCREETPMLVRFKNEFPQQLEIVGAVVFSKRIDVSPFLSAYGVNYPIIEGSYDLMGHYNKVSAVPTTVLIGKDGRVRAIYVGEQTERVYRAALQAAFDDRG